MPKFTNFFASGDEKPTTIMCGKRTFSDTIQLGQTAEVVMHAQENEENGEEKVRKFSINAYNGGIIRPMGFFGEPVIIDLAGMEPLMASIPIFRDHNPSKIVGHTESIDIGASEINLEGVISGSGPDAQEVMALADKGFPWQASVGARVLSLEEVRKDATAEVNGQTVEGPLFIARQSRLFETSFVPIGADSTTSAAIAATQQMESSDMNPELEKYITVTLGMSVEGLTDAQIAEFQAAYDAVQASKAEPAAPAAPAVPTPPVVDFRAQAAEQMQIVADIKAAAGNDEALAAQALTAGWDVERTKTEKELKDLRASRPQGGVIGTSSTSQLYDNKSIAASMQIFLGENPDEVAKSYGEESVDKAMHAQVRNIGIQGLYRIFAGQMGISVSPGKLSDHDLTRIHKASSSLQAAAGFSTVSLPGILGDVANKRMLSGYQSVDPIFDRFTSATPVNDFKEVNNYDIHGLGQYKELGPGGELKHVTLGEEAFKNKAATRGAMISLTREMIINDDLNAFARLPRILGRMGALALEKKVFEIWLGAQAAGFFAGGNDNLLTGPTSVLSIAGLSAGRKNFRDRKDPNDEFIGITPRYLMVPSSLETTAEQLMTATNVNETTNVGEPQPSNNPHTNRYELLVSSYLDDTDRFAGASTDAWYLLADPNDISAIDIAYLNNRRVPFLESSDADFNKLGMQWRSYFDWGVALQNPRAATKAVGS